MSVVGCAQSHTRKLNRPRVCIYQLTTTAVVACVYICLAMRLCMCIQPRLCIEPLVHTTTRVPLPVSTRCVYRRMCIRLCVLTCVYTCVCTYARIYECVATRVYVHVYVHTWCVYMHACVYTPPTPPCQIQNGGVHVCQRGRGAPWTQHKTTPQRIVALLTYIYI